MWSEMSRLELFEVVMSAVRPSSIKCSVLYKSLC